MEVLIDLPVGQKAFFITNNRIYEATIVEAEIFLALRGAENGVSKVAQRVVYTVNENPAGIQFKKRFEQGELFDTKEALLRSL